MAHESRLTKAKTSSSNKRERLQSISAASAAKYFKSLAWKFIDRYRYQLKPTETMSIQIHSFGDPTSFLSPTGPTPALADCVLDESSAWIVDVCRPGNLLSCCARPSIPSDLKLSSMSHHVVGFSDFATSPCRTNAYEFPIIFAFIVTVACPGSEEFPCGIETERVHPCARQALLTNLLTFRGSVRIFSLGESVRWLRLFTVVSSASQKLTLNWASLLYYYMEKEAIGRTGSAKQKENKRGNKRYKYRNEYKYRAGGGQELLVESRGRTLGCSRDAESRDKRAESDEGLSPTLLCRRPAVVQLAIASEDTVGLLIYTSEDSDKLRIALKEHYLAESRRSIDDGRFQSLWTR
ncbi:uncharacterized protein FOMMEDRAFT_162897 [Fomitiporia mediterranea MF3/22]|uniref:Uncharacterized protein n=1 Tax=Fomitiporia mediterranea (strain MF3/22) TaxID=694068 RepID=R7SGK5_FOMME|nr:uncharacterized protein FOMMEDRAFT_162897 [Fomitiporia mediterranea MF3/22]EJC97555.1 hypothetical protein FOMMEDRAFT_162897 [Fomitiporia mediterranea MF3/22]